MNDTSTPAVMAETLAELRVRFGDGAFTSRRRLLSLLADRMPEAQREIKILALALEDGAVDMLRGAGPRLSLEIDRLCAAMESRHGTRPDIARSVLTALATGLGLDTATVTAPVTPPDAGGDWLGASSVVAAAEPNSPSSRRTTAPGGASAEASPPPAAPNPETARRSGLSVALAVAAVVAVGWIAADRLGLLPSTSPPATAPSRPESPAPPPAPTTPPSTSPSPPRPAPVAEPPQGPKSTPTPTPASPPLSEPQTPPKDDQPTPPAEDQPAEDQPTEPETPSEPPVQMPNQSGAGGLPPMLVPPNGAMPLPTLWVNETKTDYGYFFSVPSGTAVPYVGLVMVSKTGGWAHSQFRAFVSSNGQSMPVFLSAETPFETMPFAQGAMRRMWVRRWVQNNLGIADVCIGVARTDVREVPKRGFRLCLFLDGCQRMIGCGEVP